MTVYSSADRISAFLKEIGDAPLFVCDMDGNVMTGYNLVEGAVSPFVLAAGDDPKSQSIPFGTPLQELESLVSAGIFEKGIFANKAMDVRLPQPLVDLVNQGVEAGEPFKIAFLTSRGSADARKLLQESGVENVDQVTLVADSGATLFLNGERKDVRTLSSGEKLHLQRVEDIGLYLRPEIESIARDHGFDLSEPVPELYVEHKGVATNIHYREILDHFGQAENSSFDKAVGERIKAALQAHAGAGPRVEKAKGEFSPVFKTLDGPATVEIKIADVNKGHGLAAIAEAALGDKRPPSSIVFTGDDVAKGDSPGTDYYAMAQARVLAVRFGIPFFNIHTHHPVDNNMSGVYPDPRKSPSGLSAAFNKPDIDLTVATPVDLQSIILRAHKKEDVEITSSPRPVMIPPAAAFRS
ncbi:MAG: hypothetical protein DI626_02720 [Micavibrio aeruginosavorus]|uniref:Uncharacterized protein n=1 Tax=Micavibrio aeruginosavorus TaxID=349221 RepID=A0A2W5C1X8_9BACT|nr:MAG: hypothetical protein DI626_02720 [Micavibrio aeruginosavorus]